MLAKYSKYWVYPKVLKTLHIARHTFWLSLEAAGYPLFYGLGLQKMAPDNWPLAPVFSKIPGCATAVPAS